jgi:hypothetical protein
MPIARIAALDFAPSVLTPGNRLAARILGMDPLVFAELLIGDRRYFHTCAWMLLLAMMVAGSGWTMFVMTFYPLAPAWAAYAVGVLVATITAMFDRALTAEKGPASLRNRAIPAIAFAARLSCSVTLSLAVSIGVSMVAVAPTITIMQLRAIDESNASLLQMFDTKIQNEQTAIQHRRGDLDKSPTRIDAMRVGESQIQARIDSMNQALAQAIADEAEQTLTRCLAICQEAQRRQVKLRGDIETARHDLTTMVARINAAETEQERTRAQLTQDAANLVQARKTFEDEIKRDPRWVTLKSDPLQAFAMFLTLLRDPKLGEAATQLKLLLFPVVLTLEFAFLLIRIGPPPHYRMLYNSIINRQLRAAALQFHRDFGTLGSWPSADRAARLPPLQLPAVSDVAEGDHGANISYLDRD